jgi:hypothetical protein
LFRSVKKDAKSVFIFSKVSCIFLQKASLSSVQSIIEYLAANSFGLLPPDNLMLRLSSKKRSPRQNP